MAMRQGREQGGLSARSALGLLCETRRRMRPMDLPAASARFWAAIEVSESALFGDLSMPCLISRYALGSRMRPKKRMDPVWLCDTHEPDEQARINSAAIEVW